MTQADTTLNRVDLADEVWVMVPGFPAYEVSDQGGVRRRNAKGRWPAGHVLRPASAKSGHLYVMLTDPEGRTRKRFVHRLVAWAFLGPPPKDDAFVLHHDDRPRNNHVDNLYWGDALQNAGDRKLNRELPPEVSQRGGQPGGSNSSAVLSESDVADIRRHLEIGLCGACVARLYGVRKETIYAIAKGRTWSQCGRVRT